MAKSLTFRRGSEASQVCIFKYGIAYENGVYVSILQYVIAH